MKRHLLRALYLAWISILASWRIPMARARQMPDCRAHSPRRLGAATARRSGSFVRVCLYLESVEFVTVAGARPLMSSSIYKATGASQRATVSGARAPLPEEAR